MTMAALLDTVEPLQRAALNAQSLAEHYRRHDLLRGHQGLGDLANELRSLAIRVITVSGPLGSLNDYIGSLATVLDTLIAAQESEDWVTVADILEYDLEPSIQRWATAVAQAAEGRSQVSEP